MKRIIVALMMSVVLVSAKSADIKNLFVEMPDSIMPLLVKNNRLDMLDYMDIGMSAKVKNKLGAAHNKGFTSPWFRYAGYKLTGSLRIARQLVACFAHRSGR